MLIPIVCISLLAYADSVLPSAYDVVIHEIMPRPSPVVGLPPCEYIELRNRSNHMVQLQDWRIAVNKREVTLPAYTLLPDSLVVLCGAAAADSAGIHNIMGIGRFPVLPDDSGLVVLYNNSRKVIHAVAYNPSWYGVSRNGKAGYSLEMADANCPCTGKSAWNAAPGSPGRYNTSVVTVAGFSGPDLYYAAVTDSQQLSICFNMAIDSVTAGDPARYQLSGNRITGATVLPPLFNTVRLQTASPLQPGNTYIITTKGITDCLQKHTGIKTAIALALPQLPTPQDV
ncbi:MAG TPA: lamin tail domain-containing protein, partial [Chitinophaga sp.]|uniref:lamin tail domain-containing protein n=1 Tax=Chitinophaga sp. TaxID=1869181 RepID=UPI002BDABA41